MTVSWQFTKLLFLQGFFRIRPVKTILLLRHAKSAWSDPRLDDHERPLNGRGERAAKAMADHIARQEPRPDLILCSTAMRTRQTLAPLVKRLGAPAPPIALEKGLYLASEDVLLAHLQAVADDVRDRPADRPQRRHRRAGRPSGRQRPAGALARLREKFPTGALAVLRGAGRPLARPRAGLGQAARLRPPARPCGDLTSRSAGLRPALRGCEISTSPGTGRRPSGCSGR